MGNKTGADRVGKLTMHKRKTRATYFVVLLGLLLSLLGVASPAGAQQVGGRDPGATDECKNLWEIIFRPTTKTAGGDFTFSFGALSRKPSALSTTEFDQTRAWFIYAHLLNVGGEDFQLRPSGVNGDYMLNGDNQGISRANALVFDSSALASALSEKKQTLQGEELPESLNGNNVAIPDLKLNFRINVDTDWEQHAGQFVNVGQVEVVNHMTRFTAPRTQKTYFVPRWWHCRPTYDLICKTTSFSDMKNELNPNIKRALDKTHDADALEDIGLNVHDDVANYLGSISYLDSALVLAQRYWAGIINYHGWCEATNPNEELTFVAINQDPKALTAQGHAPPLPRPFVAIQLHCDTSQNAIVDAVIACTSVNGVALQTPLALGQQAVIEVRFTYPKKENIVAWCSLPFELHDACTRPEQLLPMWRWTYASQLFTNTPDKGFFQRLFGIPDIVRSGFDWVVRILFLFSAVIWDVIARITNLALNTDITDATASRVDSTYYAIGVLVFQSNLLWFILVIAGSMAAWHVWRKGVKQASKTLLGALTPLAVLVLLLNYVVMGYEVRVIQKKPIPRSAGSHMGGTNAPTPTTIVRPLSSDLSATDIATSRQGIEDKFDVNNPPNFTPHWWFKKVHGLTKGPADAVVDLSLGLASGAVAAASYCDVFTVNMENLYLQTMLERDAHQQDGKAFEETSPKAAYYTRIMLSRLWERAYLGGVSAAQFGAPRASNQGACLFAARARGESPAAQMTFWTATCENGAADKMKRNKHISKMLRIEQTVNPTNDVIASPQMAGCGGANGLNTQLSEGRINPINSNFLKRKNSAYYLNTPKGALPQPNKDGRGYHPLDQGLAHLIFGSATENDSVLAYLNYVSRCGYLKDPKDSSDSSTGKPTYSTFMATDTPVYLTRTSEAYVDQNSIGLRREEDANKYWNATSCQSFLLGSGDIPPGLWPAEITDDRATEFKNGTQHVKAAAYDCREADLSVRHMELIEGGQLYTSAGGSTIANDADGLRQARDDICVLAGEDYFHRILYGVITFITAILFFISLVGLSLGTVVAQVLLAVLVMFLPLLLLMSAIPHPNARKLPTKLLKVFIAAFFAHALFIFLLALLIVFIDILTQAVVASTEPGDILRVLLIASLPLLGKKLLAAASKQFGLNVTSLKGAMSATAGLSFAQMQSDGNLRGLQRMRSYGHRYLIGALAGRGGRGMMRGMRGAAMAPAAAAGGAAAGGLSRLGRRSSMFPDVAGIRPHVSARDNTLLGAQSVPGGSANISGGVAPTSAMTGMPSPDMDGAPTMTRQDGGGIMNRQGGASDMGGGVPQDGIFAGEPSAPSTPLDTTGAIPMDGGMGDMGAGMPDMTRPAPPTRRALMGRTLYKHKSKAILLAGIGSVGTPGVIAAGLLVAGSRRILKPITRMVSNKVKATGAGFTTFKRQWNESKQYSRQLRDYRKSAIQRIGGLDVRPQDDAPKGAPASESDSHHDDQSAFRGPNDFYGETTYSENPNAPSHGIADRPGTTGNEDVYSVAPNEQASDNLNEDQHVQEANEGDTPNEQQQTQQANEGGGTTTQQTSPDAPKDVFNPSNAVTQQTDRQTDQSIAVARRQARQQAQEGDTASEAGGQTTTHRGGASATQSDWAPNVNEPTFDAREISPSTHQTISQPSQVEGGASSAPTPPASPAPTPPPASPAPSQKPSPPPAAAPTSKPTPSTSPAPTSRPGQTSPPTSTLSQKSAPRTNPTPQHPVNREQRRAQSSGKPIPIKQSKQPSGSSSRRQDYHKHSPSHTVANRPINTQPQSPPPRKNP